MENIYNYKDKIFHTYVVTLNNVNKHLISKKHIGGYAIESNKNIKDTTFDIDANLRINTYELIYTSKDYLPDACIERGKQLPTSYQILDTGEIVEIKDNDK